MQAIGAKDYYTSNWPDWYKPESADVSKMNLTVKCADRDPSLPDCTLKTSPCLYNVIDDPCEFNNVAAKHPDIVDRLLKKLLDYASR